jgi:hypothetical protein
MAKKKISSTKSVPEKSILNKIAGEVGHLAGSIAVGKDHLVEMAGEVIHSVKEKIHDITTKKKAAPKKAVKTIVKKASSKHAKPVAKK